MESACETAVPSSCEKRCGVMVQTCGNLRAVLRKGQLWMVTFTPSGVSVCSASVPARPLEVGEVLADRVGGHAQVGGDCFGAGVALTPEQLQDFHTGRTAGDGGGHIRTLGGDASTAPGYLLQVDLDKIPMIRKLTREEVLKMIKQASRAIEHMTAKERRIQRAKYARRNKMHLIDKLLNELEMLNLADQRQMPPVLSVAINKVIEESPEVTVLAQAKPASVMEAMDALYEIQDSLMYNQIEDE